MSDDVFQGRVGYQIGVDGVKDRIRLARTLSTVVADGQGRYYEQASRGNIFSLVLTAWSTTVNAGNILSAAAAAATQFALWNPSSSQVNLSLLKFAVWPISGTAPVPPLFHSMSITAPTIASAAVTPVVNNNTGKAANCNAGYLASAAGANLTGSTALKVIRACGFTLTAGAMGTTGGFGNMLIEDLGGDIVIAPGTAWVPTWMAAGTTFLGGYSITWEEIPV